MSDMPEIDPRDTTPPAKPRSVLFVCNQNSIRSPIAEALLKKHARRRIYVDSVGLVCGAPDPFTIAVMEELGIDVSRHQPALLNDINPAEFDLFIALTEPALKALERRACGRVFPPELWLFDDPSGVEGTRDQKIAVYRQLRDNLDAKIKERFRF